MSAADPREAIARERERARLGQSLVQKERDEAYARGYDQGKQDERQRQRDLTDYDKSQATSALVRERGAIQALAAAALSAGGILPISYDAFQAVGGNFTDEYDYETVHVLGRNGTYFLCWRRGTPRPDLSLWLARKDAADVHS